MILNKTYLLLIALVTLSISGCVATQEDVGGLYSRQSRLEAKVDRLTSQVATVRSNDTSSTASVNYGEQIFQLENKIFELEQSITSLNDKIINLSSSKLKPQENLPDRTFKEPVEQPGAVKTTEPDSISIPNANEFDIAYSDLARGEYASARKNFKSYISNNKSSEKVPEAVFLIADSYYREGLYEEAILEYQTLIDSYPRNSRVPLSYLKQGLSLIKIDRVEEAKLFLESLIDKYPNSQEADEAREKLTELETNG
ncbi:MAG: tetratricopeptide repeat protein [Thermodesulfobacteriota bacterium]